MARLKRTLGTATMAATVFMTVGASGHSCETEPDRGTPVIKATKKPKVKKKGTPAVEYHCFKNNGKKVCTRKAQPK